MNIFYLIKNKWIETINNIKTSNIRNCRIKKEKFDIKSNVKELEKIYDKIVGSE